MKNNISLSITNVIEKHFKLSPDHDCPDAPVSLDPKEFKNMVVSIRNVETAFGVGEFKLSSEELKSREVLRKGLYANAELTKRILEDKGLTDKTSEEIEKIRKKKIERAKTALENTKKNLNL